MLLTHLGKSPQIHPTAYVAPTATVCGDVEIGPTCRIMHGASLVAEGERISLGAQCIVLENAVIRSTARFATQIGNYGGWVGFLKASHSPSSQKGMTMNQLTRITRLALWSLLLSACMLPPMPLPSAARGDSTTAAGSDEAAERLQAPEGFTINTYFSDLDSPRLMTVGPDGHLYVAETGAGAVIRLPDTDGDGVADERQVLAEGLSGPHSVEWFEGSLIVATNNRVLRMTDANGDGDFLDEGDQVAITDNIPTGGGHSSRTAHVGPDGLLYVAAGSSSNITIERDRRRAAIMRFNLDGSLPADNPFVDDPEETRRPVWAEGLRNSVDFLFLPDGRLWANHNGSDGLGDDAPPEEIVIEVAGGKHYGWPYCYTAELGVVPADAQEIHDTRVPFDKRLSDCSTVTPALLTDLAHQAPLGMVYYEHTAFPPDYQGNLFVAYHGSWNSGVPRDCRIQRVIVADGAPAASEPFVTGFRDNDDQHCGGAWGRPAGVAVGANGELFISDDQNGNIYRVVYRAAGS